jgi:CxxC motif-containing protein (DUF1111 family)
MKKPNTFALVVATLVLLQAAVVVRAQLLTSFQARDPGVRGGSAGAGAALPGLTTAETAFFEAGKAEFVEAEEVDEGLGPRLNLDSCAGCHAQPAVGGSSPAINPQKAFAAGGYAEEFPRDAIFAGRGYSYTTGYGPIREVRFKSNPDGSPDGGVHNTATIRGRLGATAGCSLAVDDINGQFAAGNVTFRVPTPVFGTGLIEAIPDTTIVANQAANAAAKIQLGIVGSPNRVRPTGETNNNGNDGTIARFGWKAQNMSLLLFSGEAYNVEMGISNELFHQDREQKNTCVTTAVAVPNSVTDSLVPTTPDGLSAIDKFAFFQRLLAPPTPSTTVPGGSASIATGRSQFWSIGCALCHTPTMKTGNAGIAALRNKNVNLFSDLLIHNMGPGLADDIAQGQAGGDEFRTAPLWGLGQRVFFLHDGRADDLIRTIAAHKSAGNAKYGPSEANAVVDNFAVLSETNKQHLLNFLRSL